MSNVGEHERFSIFHGDVLETLRGMSDASADAVLSDVPYGLGSRQPTAEELIAYLRGEELDTAGDFMGKAWFIPSVAVWREVFRVLKPGAPLLIFGGSRTFDLIALGMRAAGFIVRDTIMWVTAQGMPKPASTTDRYIDWHLGTERQVVGTRTLTGNAAVSTKDKGGTYGVQVGTVPPKEIPVTAPGSEEAKRWEGWGHALRPSHEPVIVAMRPLEGSIAENVLKHDVGALNVKACRLGRAGADAVAIPGKWQTGGAKPSKSVALSGAMPGHEPIAEPGDPLLGRWPPNVIVEHDPRCLHIGSRSEVRRVAVGEWRKTSGDAVFSDGRGLGGTATEVAEVAEVAEEWDCHPLCPVNNLDIQSGDRPGMSGGGTHREGYAGGMFGGIDSASSARNDGGGASRFFFTFQRGPEDDAGFMYEPKVSRSEREFGCESLPVKTAGECVDREEGTAGIQNGAAGAGRTGGARNNHVSLKPIRLTTWLATMLLPPPRENGKRRILIPYCGASSEMIGALRAGWDEVVGIEADASYIEIGKARIERWASVPASMAPAEAIRSARGASNANDRQASLFVKIAAGGR